MVDISLHLLDLLQNSAHAGATRVEVTVHEDARRDLLSVKVKDNGKGMDVSLLDKVLDPFCTTSAKRVGLGLSFVAQAAAMAGGTLQVASTPGNGAEVAATFTLSHVDRQPLGDLAATAVAFLAGNPGTDLSVSYTGRLGRTFRLDTWREFPQAKRAALGQMRFLWIVEDRLSGGLAKAGFSPDGGGIGVEVC